MKNLITERAIELVKKALIYECFIVEFSEFYVEENDLLSFALKISIDELQTDDGPYCLLHDAIVQIDYDGPQDGTPAGVDDVIFYSLITGEDNQNPIDSKHIYMLLFFENALIPKAPQSGIELAKDFAPEHAKAMEAMKDQLIITLIKRLGYDISIPVQEIDETGGNVLTMQLVKQDNAAAFRFKVENKQ